MFIVVSLSSCSNNSEEADYRHTIPGTEGSPTAEVQIIKLRPQLFSHEVISNGKMEASEYVNLRFATSDAVIECVAVKNGQRVTKGQVLASLDQFKLKNAVARARNTLDKSNLDLADALIGQGYDPEKVEEIPSEVMCLARIQSGIAQAEIQLREAERALAEATLRAPFDGVVANLSQKAGNLPDAQQPFCRIIATGEMEVNFPILESELPLVRVVETVEVSPYSSSQTYQGQVSAINPIIDENGIVTVTATITRGIGLYDGMNVRVSVKCNVEEALVVPKSAVVLRSGGRQVVFTHENGKAMWNYVTISFENLNEYVVTEGLKAGQEVIVCGNQNLAHESPVKSIQ